MSRLFAELKRRHVYRAAVVYAMVAWLLTQVATQVFPFFDIPNSEVRFVIVALVLGFPIAMSLVWIYEFTSKGFVPDEDVDSNVRKSAGRVLDYIDFWWKGDTHLLKSLLAEIPSGIDPDGALTTCRWDVAMIERDNATAKRAMETSPLNEFSYMNAGATPKSFFQGCISLAQGDAVAARALFDAARPSFEEAVKESPNSAERHAYLGLLNAFMERKDDAIREGRRAVELKPESADAFDGAIMNCILALIYARCGEKDLAFLLIERLLQTPGAVDSVDHSITVNDLKFRWKWDPIRSDPRFQKLANAKP